MGLFHDKPGWQNPFYSFREEVANSVTHGVGAGLSVLGLVVLLVLAVRYGSGWHVAAFTVFGASLVLLYSASTLYHAIQHPRAKRLLRKLDHAAIYLLIAGTYTPFLLLAMRGPRAWTLLGVIWGIALLGVLWKVFFLGRFEVLATIGYVLMGWLGVLAARDLLAGVPPAGMLFLFAGGLIYTGGVIIYALERLPYNHAVWHVFVLAGSACHFAAVVTLL